MTGQDIVTRVRKLMIDLGTNPRFTDDDWLEFLVDAPAAILTIKPTASVVTESVTLAEGAEQSLPTGTIYLHDIVTNTDEKSAVRRVNRAQLDQFRPGWQSMTKEKNAKHFSYMSTDPLVFYVYPPNDGTGAVDAKVTKLPTPITSLSDTLPFGWEYVEVYLFYVAYRAFDWDSDEPSNFERAQSYFQRFSTLLGASLQNAHAISPNKKEA